MEMGSPEQPCASKGLRLCHRWTRCDIEPGLQHSYFSLWCNPNCFLDQGNIAGLTRRHIPARKKAQHRRDWCELQLYLPHRGNQKVANRARESTARRLCRSRSRIEAAPQSREPQTTCGLMTRELVPRR